jgi:hypothetical protein
MVLAVAAIPHLTVRVDGVNLCTRENFGAMTGSRRGQCAADCAHAADRDVPVTGAAAKQVIEETHVLRQRRVVGAGESADHRVGRHHTANQVVANRLGDGVSDRAPDHRMPRRIGVGITSGQHIAARFVAGAQRVGQRRPQPGGDDAAATVELGEPRLVVGGPDRRERRVWPDQQARAPRRRRIGRVRRVAAAHQPHPDTQFVDDAARQQADQI